MGCVCLTVDIRGHAETQEQKGTVTREDNLRDALAAYDTLVSHQAVDKEAIGAVGSSYGGYRPPPELRVSGTAARPARSGALPDRRAAAQEQLKKYGLADYRRGRVTPDQNRALAACAAFRVTWWWGSRSTITSSPTR